MTQSLVLPRKNLIERLCRLILLALAACFVIAGTGFLFMPDATVQALNETGDLFGSFIPMPVSALRFWLTLATGYMVLVAALAYLAQRDLPRRRDLVGLLVLGKATTSLVALGFYVYSAHAFVYLVTFVVDGSITLTAIVIWLVVPFLAPPRPAGAEGAPESAGASPSTPLTALLEAMVPDGGPFEEGAARSGLAHDIEVFVAGLTPTALTAFRIGLAAFDVSPFFLPPFRMQRFSRLPLAQRVRILEAWERSRWAARRQAVHALKLLAMTQFYGRPEVEARLGYPHPLVRVPRAQESA